MINMQFDARQAYGESSRGERRACHRPMNYLRSAPMRRNISRRSELEKALDRIAAEAEEARRKCDQLLGGF